MKVSSPTLEYPELLTIIDSQRFSASRSCSSSKLWSIDLRIVIERVVQQDLALEMDLSFQLCSHVSPQIIV